MGIFGPPPPGGPQKNPELNVRFFWNRLYWESKSFFIVFSGGSNFHHAVICDEDFSAALSCMDGAPTSDSSTRSFIVINSAQIAYVPSGCPTQDDVFDKFLESPRRCQIENLDRYKYSVLFKVTWFRYHLPKICMILAFGIFNYKLGRNRSFIPIEILGINWEMLWNTIGGICKYLE